MIHSSKYSTLNCNRQRSENKTFLSLFLFFALSLHVIFSSNNNNDNNYYYSVEAFTSLYSSPHTKRLSSYYARNYRKQSFLLLLMSQDNFNNKDDDKQIIDATVIDSSNNNDSPSEISDNETSDRNELELSSKRRKRDIIRDAIKRIASLSLEDYKWRSEVFKTNEADRELEKSLARMRGEKASYLRPMDATDEDLGPLVSFFSKDLPRYRYSLSHHCMTLLFVTLFTVQNNRDKLKRVQSNGSLK